MDLKRAAHAKKSFEQESEEAQGALAGFMLEVQGFIDKELPCLPDGDKAAVAWYVSELIAGIMNARVGDLAELLANSASGYALAAVKYLGWMDQDPPADGPEVPDTLADGGLQDS